MTALQLDARPEPAVPEFVDLSSPLDAIVDALQRVDYELDGVPEELRLVALNLILDGVFRRRWEGERQKLEPWGSWMHSTYLDTAPAGVFESEESRSRLPGWDGANLIYSKWQHDARPDAEADHMPMFDIDLEMRVVPSSTPGKGHLYINKPMPWAKVEALLAALVEAGIVHRNYLKHSQARGYTCLRPAFISKPADYNARFGSDGGEWDGEDEEA